MFPALRSVIMLTRSSLRCTRFGCSFDAAYRSVICSLRTLSNTSRKITFIRRTQPQVRLPLGREKSGTRSQAAPKRSYELSSVPSCLDGRRFERGPCAFKSSYNLTVPYSILSTCICRKICQFLAGGIFVQTGLYLSPLLAVYYYHI